MTLRRCDSLPSKLREAPITAEVTQPLNKIPDSNTDPDIEEAVVRDEVIATWKSLYTDVKNIQNGFTAKNGPSRSVYGTDKRSITHTFSPASARNNRETQKKITYDRQVVLGAQDADRISSFPADTGQGNSDRKPKSVRRRTLLERLLSWRTPECDCHIECPSKYQPIPKPRPEDVLCTCGVVRPKFATNNKSKYSERGRSKSVGYEAAREVTQFRRCASAGATVGAETAAALRARAALTLARRYYPEGGWGWTVTVVGTIVQILSHGLQLGGGSGAIACTASVKYRVPPLYTYGE